MTNEEAKHRLQSIYMELSEGNKQAIDKAIYALEKQIPKKPYHDDAVGVPNGCPCCDTIVNIGEDFCPSCGQAIDWS